MPRIAKPKAKINTRESWVFLVLTEKESAGLGAGVKSRVRYAPNLENTDCGTWQRRAWLILHLVLFPSDLTQN